MKFLIVEKVHEAQDKLAQSIKELDKKPSIVIADSVYNMFSNLSKVKDFDYIFIDFDMLGEEWRRQIKRLCEDKGDAKFVFFSDISDNSIISFVFSMGCYGCVPKSYKKEILSSVLFLMFNGCPYVPSSILKSTKNTEHSEIKNYRLPDGKMLTPRQIEVLGFLSKGLSNKQIAFEMSVSEATVKLHMNALLKNLDVNNRTQAVISAQKFGFI